MLFVHATGTTAVAAETRTAAIALILGIVCTVVLTIVVIVGLVMCCVRCCCRSSQGQGQVVTTGQPLTVITTGSNTTSGAYNAGYVYPPQPAPGTHYTQPAGTAQPPPSYPPGPVPAYPTETGQAKVTTDGTSTYE
ncbi:uncharacterized protein LOC124276031 [Haliotis rubra]|uniref:uncharacterized protein LOC124276031 n=1 Tax=Haliotis rubra TaxID=36100 RepID=UPI001EE5D1F4|nr:uncharacterized protein LOC124276031 [Haliotis rubra]